MGLFDDVSKLAGAASGLTGGAGGGMGNAALLAGVLQLLDSSHSSGGLLGILNGFQKSGLGDAVASWVSTGQNLPISPTQLQNGLGAAHVSALARQAGMSEGDAASALAGLLPMVVDRLTPGGSVPQSGELPQVLGALRGLLG